MDDEFNFRPVVVEWDERHVRVLKCFLESLESKGVKYVILKNDNGLPYENHSKDVDIVIEPGSYQLAAQLLYAAYKENGVNRYKIHRFERLRCWYGMNVDTRFAIHIDLLEGFLHKGFEMFPFEMMYRYARKNEHGVYVLDDVFGTVVLLLHSTICYHTIKDKYATRIAEVYGRSKREMDILFYQLFPGQAASVLITLLEQGDYEQIAHKGKWFSHQSKKRILLHHPCLTLRNVMGFFWEKAMRIVIGRDKYNTFISVHAPDGTGKTTFIRSLSGELGFYFVCDPKDLVRIFHFRPSFLPNLGAAGEKLGVMKQDTNFTVPHRARPANPLCSFLRMAYYWMDYAVGVSLILRRNAQFDKITLFDRYIYDFLVDPRRARIQLPYRICQCFTKWVKQPRIVFVLDTDADTIYARKQELTREEIERQLAGFKKLSSLGSRVHLLDAAKRPDEIARNAMKIVADTFTRKIE